MRVRSWFGAAAPALVAVGLAASPLPAQGDDADWLERCREDRGGRGERYCEVRETGFRAPGGTIAVDGRENGGVAVEGWDRDSVLVRARIQAQAPTEAEAREVADRIRIATSGGTISADGPASRRGASWSVSYDIFVPRNSDLAVETTNGPISVEAVNGRMELDAENGPISLSSVSGDVRARASNGPLAVDLTGTRWEGRGLDAETTNGPVELTLPERYSARLETGTVNGPMNIDFPITLQGRIGKRISTDLGSGGPPIRVVTTNGPVIIRRQ